MGAFLRTVMHSREDGAAPTPRRLYDARPSREHLANYLRNGRIADPAEAVPCIVFVRHYAVTGWAVPYDHSGGWNWEEPPHPSAVRFQFMAILWTRRDGKIHASWGNLLAGRDWIVDLLEC